MFRRRLEKKSILPICAKWPCCLELFVCCYCCWDIAGGMSFSVFVLAADRFVTIGRRTAQFCFGLLMRRLFLGLSPPRRLPHSNAAALRVGLYCRPELSIIRLKNNNIHLKLDESFVHFGKSFDFMIPTDSERRLEMQNFAFTTVLCQFWYPLLRSLAGVRRSRCTCWNLIYNGESVERVPALWLQTTPQESARWCH